MINKTQKVLEHLVTYKTITSWEAIQKYRASRLSVIIFNLKERGHIIETEMVRSEEGPYAIYHYLGVRNEN